MGHVAVDSSRASAVFIILGFLLAWTPFAVALQIRSKLLKVLCAIVAFGWGLWCALVALFLFPWAFTTLATGIDGTFEKVADFDINRHHLIAYRTNGGAMTQFGIVVREERALIGGIKLVHVLADAYCADDADLSSTRDDKVRIQIHHYGCGGEESKPDVRSVGVRSLWF